jgi:2-oxoglutarate dehydrogenase E1 component
VNNQIGFTTGPKDARSSLYSTDVAKSVHAPIFHVNGDHPEDAVRVMRLAFAFRQEFKRDVVIDLVCYRRWGHNEGDDPSYTQPLVYQRIENHRSVRKIYTEQLLRRGDLDEQSAEKAVGDFRVQLQGIHDAVKKAATVKAPVVARDREAELGVGVEATESCKTAIREQTVAEVLDALDREVPGFEAQPKLAKQLAKRRERAETDKIDWALAEAFAFGSLVLEGHPVRLSGEDTGRGTFSQRHVILYDHRNGAPYVPLANIRGGQAPFTCYDSLLSEFGVLGFEYGYSVSYPKALVMWEAQFGDFVNGAQVIIDQFIASAEQKWGQTCSLAMLLPHGYEGQGPEHSSARIERFLQLAAAGNWRVCNPTTPAQYFHLLRRQVKSEQRKPVVVFTPKSLLRHPEAVSTKEQLLAGSFNPVLVDDTVSAKAVTRVIVCSGKIYYDLAQQRAEKKLANVAIARLEQYYPFPAEQLAAELAKYTQATQILWVQEEPRNMGAWDFVDERLLSLLTDGQTLRYVGRASGSSPATGSSKRHAAEQAAVVAEALEGEGKPTFASGQKVVETREKQPQRAAG